jgi:hypothetical protein
MSASQSKKEQDVNSIVKFLMVVMILLLIVSVGLFIYDASIKDEGCVTEGVVVNMVIEEERVWTTSVTMLVGKSVVIIPMVHVDDKDFILELLNNGRRGKVYVTQEDFNKVRIGDYYKGNKDSYRDDVVKKEVHN